MALACLPDFEAAAFGMFALLSPPAQTPVFMAEDVKYAIRQFGCHSNMAGFVLGNTTAPINEVIDAASTMRLDGYWQMPLAIASDVPHATTLAAAGVPLPAVHLPPYPAAASVLGSGAGADAATAWGAAALTTLAALSNETHMNETNEMAMVVALNPCAPRGSDSLLRFGA